MKNNIISTLGVICLVFGCLLLYSHPSLAQGNSVVLVHTKKAPSEYGKARFSSGYGVAYGGPNHLQNRIVTPLHVVVGMDNIAVAWNGTYSIATIEKIYKEADLALLKLETPLGIPALTLYSGDPPWDTNINYWEKPSDPNKKSFERKTTQLEEATRLSAISNDAGISKALCRDGSQYYPNISTEILRFTEANIQKAASGSPLTYNNQIVGLVDGGTKPANGKSTVWATSTKSISRLFTHGTPPQPMEACGGVNGSPYMYSGERSDNGWMSDEEKAAVAKLEKPITIQTPYGEYLNFHLEYRLSYADIYESLFYDEQKLLDAHLANEDAAVVNKVKSSIFDVYVEATSGINIIIPADAKWVIEKQEFGTFLVVTSPDYTSSMSYYIALTGDINSGLNSMESFQINMAELGYNVYNNPYAILNNLKDSYRPYYRQKNVTINYDSYGNPLGNTIIQMVVNDGAFFGQVHQIYDLERQEKDPVEGAYYVLFDISMLLSDFKYF